MQLVVTLAVLSAVGVWLAWWYRHRAVLDGRGLSSRPHPPPALPPIEGPGDPDLDAFLTRQIHRRSYYFRTTLQSGQEIAVGYSPEEDWVDVAARRRLWRDEAEPAEGPYEEFSYHMRQGRWSFGAEPPNAAEISGVLLSHLGDPARRRALEESLTEASAIPWPEPPVAKRRRRETGPRIPRGRAPESTAPPPAH